MTISFELAAEYRQQAPPFSESCPNCAAGGVVIPHATMTDGDQLLAKYTHGRCGHDWVTSWNARWDDTWQRLGPGQKAIAA